ncbi:phosphatidate phosphatase [Galdieria sulphuraria]|uniref:Phosphatidate phosphatase n=1 Tax=Galdieria sulphuraria TaxID=130081 RepID=M2VTQ4_GALSU|nr:phosphatidate phosphatase [Galdieria sulphuraria]EME26591.1 phosphatidate phosphatase [Galdieria sulphuraria]|eukprot:XP_005703111.1 phosphatidate phosphatase [Galdieria sulphuraria]
MSSSSSLGICSSRYSGKQALTYLKDAYLIDWFTLGVFGVIFPFILKTSVHPYRRQVALDDPQFSHPFLKDIVSTQVCTLSSLLIPCLVGVIVEWRWVRRTKRWIPAIFNLHIFILGLLEATLCTVTITEILKLVAGRPRPYFLSVCEPINGSTINCQGNAAQIEEARKSFPSGHTSLAFAAAVYLTLYFIKIFWLSEGFYRNWHLWLLLVPLLLASFVGVSRTMDYHHHFSDIVAGAWLGTV